MRNRIVCNISLLMPEESMGLEMLSWIRFIAIVKEEPGFVRNDYLPNVYIFREYTRYGLVDVASVN